MSGRKSWAIQFQQLPGIMCVMFEYLLLLVNLLRALLRSRADLIPEN